MFCNKWQNYLQNIAMTNCKVIFNINLSCWFFFYEKRMSWICESNFYADCTDLNFVQITAINVNVIWAGLVGLLW